MPITPRRFAALVVAPVLMVGPAPSAFSRSVGVTVTPASASPQTVVLTR